MIPEVLAIENIIILKILVFKSGKMIYNLLIQKISLKKLLFYIQSKNKELMI